MSQPTPVPPPGGSAMPAASSATAALATPLATPLVSVVVVTHNSADDIACCVSSLGSQTWSHWELIVVDNASTDDTVARVQASWPQARLIRRDENVGYAAGNNMGFRHARGDVLAVLNPDTRVAPGWLEPLVEALGRDPQVGLATPKIALIDRPSLINTCGNAVTFAGLTVCRGLEAPVTAYTQAEDVAAVSGAAFVIRRDVLEAIGGFNESFFTYYEDTDLSLRARVAGWRCRFVPASLVQHKFHFRMSPSKCYWIERNRYAALAQNLRWPTLLALLPALAFSELVVWTYVIGGGPGLIAAKLRSLRWLLTHTGEIRRNHRVVQRLRRTPDRELLRSFTSKLTLTQTVPPVIARPTEALVTTVLWVCGRFARLIVWW
ncbi:MAG: glycosyltransferase [Luteitalea sp.]|nr:glycosyltransferase [Luteitalea sp.]